MKDLRQGKRQGEEEEVTVHKKGKKYIIYDRENKELQTGFKTKKEAEMWAMDNDYRLVNATEY